MQNQKALFKTRQRQLTFTIKNRRYIGNKAKLTDWIMYLINSEIEEKKSFADIFAGTGSVTNAALNYFENIITNDFLYSNNIVYKAFFENSVWDSEKLLAIISIFNQKKVADIEDNYFSENFGNKYFHVNTAKKIGYIRDEIENLKTSISEKEYNILLASLLYTIDKIANTVGHYEAYFKKIIKEPKLELKLITPIETNKVRIFQKDANQLVREIETDVVYLDPPYNSRQYSRFYHLLETLIKWDKPKLYGVALKPKPENVSKYCKVSAKSTFEDLVMNIKGKNIVVSYNNTYNPKSKSSKNKISLLEIETILTKRGKTKIFENSHRFFNTGNTEFNNHKELVFITKIDD